MFLDKFFGSKIDLSHFVFEVTQSCNHDCVFCYNVWKTPGIDYPEGELSTEEIKDIICKLKEETKLELISISGGEPLTRDDIPELIDFMSNMGIESNLITNGSLLDEETAMKCVKSGVSLFEIPFLAVDKEKHKKLVGKGTFDQAMKGASNVKKVGGKLVASLVVTSENIGDVKEIGELAIAMGADGIMFNRFNPGGRGLENLELLPSADKVEEALWDLDELSGEYGIPVSCSIPIQPCIIDLEKYKNIEYGFCPSGGKDSYYTVDSSGNMRICNHIPKIIGNIQEESMEDIMEKDFVKKFRKAIPDHCSDCDNANTCWGGCKASAKVCYGSLEEMEPFLRENLKTRT